MSPLKQLVLFLAICTSIAACNTTNTAQTNPAGANKQALCKEMKYQMIFNGKTSNQHTAMQQRAGMANLNRSYREAGC